MMADQLSALALSCYGNKTTITPNIDRLAASGVVFDAAYSSNPLCAPARYAFMTGRFSSNCGGYDNAAYLSATEPTFAHYLRLMGYRTSLCGKMHFVGPDQLHGFEQRLTTDIYPADFGWVPDWSLSEDKRIDLWYHNMSSVKQAGVAAITNQLTYDDEVGARAIQALYDHARGTDGRPLCMVVGFIHPHDPYATRQRFWDLYDNVDIPLPTVGRLSPDQQDAHSRRLEKVIALDSVDITDNEIRNARRAYYGNVSYIDEWLGRLLDTIEECGMTNNTTVIFTSDHGDMLGERGIWYKMSCLEWSNRIPLIIYHPSRFSKRRVAEPVSHVDLLPSLLELASESMQCEKPHEIDPLDGRSLIPACDNMQQIEDSDKQVAISEYLGEGTVEPMLMIRRQQYKYINCPGDPDLLFDLNTDPNELTNLALKTQYDSVLREFQRQARSHWDVKQIKEDVIASQKRRRAVHAALAVGHRHSWDFNPLRNASEEFTRSHMELSDFDATSRYPRPPEFKPRWR